MSRGRRAHLRGAAAGACVLACVAAGAGAAASAAAGCGAVYGGAPHAAARAYVPPSRAYRVFYLAPPWVLGEARGERVVLTVPLTADEIVSGGRAVPVITLTVDVAAGSPAALVAARAAAAGARGARVQFGPRPVAMGAGTQGVEAAFDDGNSVERVAAAALADGRAVLLLFTSGAAIDADGDVAQMVADFEPRPPGM